MIDSIPQDEDLNGIAIIGMSGRFPGAANIGQLWENLVEGRESIKRFSDDELIAKGADPEQLKDPSYVRARAALDGPDLFDAAFFDYSKRDAELADPQQRVFLECSWETLEDAGYDPARFNGTIGVYAGSSLNTYLLNNVLANRDNIQKFTQGFQVDGYNILIANDKDYLATRVAYKLDLRGPALTIQTACSTSLVAICQAANALTSYQCDMALAGGVSITFPQERGYIYQEGAIASADGHCRAFDANAQGTVFGSGCGVVLLKRLEDAIADRDHIYATLKGCATNNDGSDKVSYMAPSVNGQSEVIALAQALADVSAESISYIEAHGTVTPLGDPIEVAALTQAFAGSTDKRQFCGIGTAKTNFGHLEAAAGVAGVIKTALSLEHKILPPSLHYTKSNPKIDFPSTPFYVVSELSEWKDCPMPRRAGVSSFGVGGTNAHVVMEEAPVLAPTSQSRKNQLFLLSAKSGEALDQATNNLSDFLGSVGRPEELADVAYTLNQGRRAFDCRRIFVAQDANGARELIAKADPKQLCSQDSRHSNPEIVFMFPGQGAQYINMGRELYQTEPVFRETVDICSELVREELELDIRDLLFPVSESEKEAKDELTRTVYTQPALFIVMYAQAKLWMSWGVVPSAMVGHSAGEYVAATLSGVIKLEDALNLIAVRARDMQNMPGGGMLSVRAPEDKVVPLLSGSLAIAAVNSRSLTVVAGPHDELEVLTKTLEENKILSKSLHTSHAFHSSMMDPMVEPFREKVSQVELSPAQIPIVSSFTGDWINPEDWTDPRYWANQLRGAVRFADAVSTLAEEPNRILLEVGPGQTLSTLAASNPSRQKEQICLASMPPIENPAEQAAMLRTLGKLWLAGYPIAWDRFYSDEQRSHVSLPTYPFQKQRYWIEGQVESSDLGPDDLNESVALVDAESIIEQQLKIMMKQLDRLKGIKS